MRHVRLSVVIVTYRRLWHLQQCLRALRAQTHQSLEIIVVDSDPDESARGLCAANSVAYIPSGLGLGQMTAARNIGWRQASGEIVAFIDDDAFPTDAWALELITTFSSDNWAAAGGRAIANPAQQPSELTDQVGQVLKSGELIANFETDGPQVIEVQHLIGCNMAFRRSALETMDGFKEDYPGTALREETDLFFRLRAAGLRCAYNPKALVIHVGAPHAKGRRFDIRYQYYATRNHMQLLVGNSGHGGKAWRYATRRLFHLPQSFARDLAAAFVRPMIALLALSSGLVAGLRRRLGGSR